jgi:hypothetical protein
VQADKRILDFHHQQHHLPLGGNGHGQTATSSHLSHALVGGGGGRLVLLQQCLSIGLLLLWAGVRVWRLCRRRLRQPSDLSLSPGLMKKRD